jgi:hypothetical protein
MFVGIRLTLNVADGCQATVDCCWKSQVQLPTVDIFLSIREEHFTRSCEIHSEKKLTPLAPEFSFKF